MSARRFQALASAESDPLLRACYEVADLWDQYRHDGGVQLGSVGFNRWHELVRAAENRAREACRALWPDPLHPLSAMSKIRVPRRLGQHPVPQLRRVGWRILDRYPARRQVGGGRHPRREVVAGAALAGVDVPAGFRGPLRGQHSGFPGKRRLMTRVCPDDG